VKEGYVLIYDIRTGMRVGIFKRHVPFEFLMAHKGIIVKKKLDSRGFFSLGIPKTHNLEKYPNAPVIVEIPFGLTISKLYVYNEKGELLKEHKIIKVFSATGKLIRCCFHLSEREFSLLDDVVIETKLDKNGYLQIGGKVRGHFQEYKGNRVRFEVHHGVITKISFLDTLGNIVATQNYILIYDEKFNLVASTQRRLPRVFEKGIFYLEKIIGPSGKLKFKKKTLITSSQYAGGNGFIKIVNGQVVSFWVVKDNKVVFGRPPCNFNLENKK